MPKQTEARAARFTAVEPQLFVRDLPRALIWYRRALGFSVAFQWGQPPFYAQIARDGLALNLRLTPGSVLDHTVDRDLLSASILVDDISAQYAGFLTTGETPHRPLTRQPWHGPDQAAFILADPDGNLLQFAGPMR